MLREVTISITGHGLSVSVTDPNGRPYTRGQVVHIDNEETYVMVIHEPSPAGMMTLAQLSSATAQLSSAQQKRKNESFIF
jgi:hypothetical protein